MRTLHSNKKTWVVGVMAVVLLVIASAFTFAYPKIYEGIYGENAGLDVYDNKILKVDIVSCIRYMEYQDQAGEENAAKSIKKTKIHELLEKNTTIWSEQEQNAREEERALTEQEKTEIEEEINAYTSEVYEGYRQSADWISSVPTLSLYMVNEKTKAVVTNNEKMKVLLTQECHDTQFKDYDFLIKVTLSGDGYDWASVEPLICVTSAFTEELERGYNYCRLETMDTEISDRLQSSWFGSAIRWNDAADKTLYIGIKDQADLNYLYGEQNTDYDWCALQGFYVLEVLLFLALFAIGKRVLAGTESTGLSRYSVPTEGILLVGVLGCVILPFFTVMEQLTVYSYRRNLLGGVLSYISLAVLGGMAYLAVMTEQEGRKKELKENSLLYKFVIRYMLKGKTIKLRKLSPQTEFTIRLTGGEVLWVFVLVIMRQAAIDTVIYKFPNPLALKVLINLVSIALLFLLGIRFNQKRKRKLQDYENYQILVTKAEEISKGTIGSPIKEDLGKYNPLKDAINNMSEGLTKAVEEAVKSQSMKTELITNVSHDLKTPLTSIVSYVDLLKRKDLDDGEKREYIEILEQKSARLKTLIEDLFEMSKAASRDVKLTCTELNIVALTREVLVEHEPAMDKKDLKVNMSYLSDTIKVNLDGQKTYRIISNLVSNITKYTMPHTRVYVAITKDESDVILEFKNISATELTRQGEELTERFVRGDESRNTDGSGLGLAIAKSLTELQQGSLKVEADGDLFKVRITFPLAN